MTDELKKAMESAKTDEEINAVVEKFKEEIAQLSNEELDQFAGGRPICAPGSIPNGRNGCVKIRNFS